MTFPQLQYLLEIHRTGSVTQAAKNLFVTQSSVSIALNTLEKELGFPIFIRSKKGLTPTPRGAAVIEHATHICESHRLMTAPEEQKHTNLRISGNAFPPSQAAFIRLVKENRDRRDIYFSFTSGEGSFEKIKNFNQELGISMTLSPHYLSKLQTIERFGLESQLLTTLPGCIRLGKGHRLFDAEHVTLEDLKNDLLLDTPTASVSNSLLTAGVPRILPQHRIASMHHGVRKQLIREGLAYEINYHLPGLSDPEHRYFPLEGLNFKIHAITNPQRPPIPELDRFLELLREELRQAGV
jgi:DNA-binding transcriptional LysR family regulator